MTASFGIGTEPVGRFIRDGILPAEQVMRCARYQIRASDLENKLIKAELACKSPCCSKDDKQKSLFSAT